MTLVLYYFQNCLGESAENPNAFYLPPNSGDITFGSFLSYFPVKDPNLHFRVKCTDPSLGYVWRDITTRDQTLPLYQDAIFLKILRHDRAVIEKQLRVLALQKSLARSNVSVPSSSSAKFSVDISQKVQSPAAPSPVRIQKPATPSTANSGTPTAATAAPTAPSPTGPPITRQPSVDMLDFGTPRPPTNKGPSAAPSYSGSSASVDIDTDISAAGPKLTRDELVQKRQDDIDEKVQTALQNKRDLDDKAAKESAEVDLAREKHDKNLLAWATNNKEKRNIRTLLSTMHTVLWKGNTWKPIGLGDVIDSKGIKLNYRKAMLVVHPDRCSHLDSETKFIAKRVFEAINEAYDVFLAKEGLS